ncbi:MAG: hypothetical protein ABIQ55_03820, partial [Gemmatimonadaceae bacterium]
APASRTIVVGADGKTQTVILQGADPGAGGSTVPALAPPSNDEFAEGAALGVTMTLLTLGVFALYNRFKNRGMKRARAEVSGESAARLERVERGVEAIAIEIERISEGQRFVTKALADTRVPVTSSEKPNG